MRRFDYLICARARIFRGESVDGELEVIAGEVKAGRNKTTLHRVHNVMGNNVPVRVVAVSGSLRRASSNSALVEAVARLAEETVEVSIYRELETIPPFNPDIDDETPPETVVKFRSTLQACDAVLISSPEYAHGVPGVLKNALDWVVGSGELIGMPIALINASARATHARASLAETLATMSAHVVGDASITVPLDGRALDANGIIGDGDLSAALRAALAVLASTVRNRQGV